MTQRHSSTGNYFSHPTRPRQVQTGIETAPVRRHSGSATFFCVQTVDFDGIVLDYEGLALVYRNRRHLLSVKSFRIVEALLSAEGDDVTTEHLASACGVVSENHRRSVVSHLVLKLRRTVFTDPHVALIEFTTDRWHLKRP